MIKLFAIFLVFAMVSSSLMVGQATHRSDFASHDIFRQYSTLRDIEVSVANATRIAYRAAMHVNDGETATIDANMELLLTQRGEILTHFADLQGSLGELERDVLHYFDHYMEAIFAMTHVGNRDAILELAGRAMDFEAHITGLLNDQIAQARPDMPKVVAEIFERYSILRDIEMELMRIRALVNLEVISLDEEIQVRWLGHWAALDTHFSAYMQTLIDDEDMSDVDRWFMNLGAALQDAATVYLNHYVVSIIEAAYDGDMDMVIFRLQMSFNMLMEVYDYLDMLLEFTYSLVDAILLGY